MNKPQSLNEERLSDALLYALESEKSLRLKVEALQKKLSNEREDHGFTKEELSESREDLQHYMEVNRNQQNLLKEASGFGFWDIFGPVTGLIGGYIFFEMILK